MQDAESIWGMQLKAFEELLERYQDFDVSPGNTQDLRQNSGKIYSISAAWREHVPKSLQYTEFTEKPMIKRIKYGNMEETADMMIRRRQPWIMDRFSQF